MKLSRVFLAIFAINISIVCSNYLDKTHHISKDRRAWANSIEADFRIAQFGGNDTKIPPVSITDTNNNKITLFSLDHVLAWSQIYWIFDDLMQKWAKNPSTYTNVIEFIRKVFQIDNQAYINPAFCNSKEVKTLKSEGWNHQCQRIAHKDLLKLRNLGGDCPTKNKKQAGTNAHFCGQALEAFEQIRNHVNIVGNLNKILDNLFNAPANLRYGDSKTNSVIREVLDPMGKADGRLTTKEQYWVTNIGPQRKYSVQHDETISISEPCFRPKTNKRLWEICYMSSTGHEQIQNKAKQGYANELHDDLFKLQGIKKPKNQ